MSGFRDGLRLRLSDPTPGSGPQNVPPGSLGSEDSEEEVLDPQRGVGGDLNTWNWNRSAPVSTSYAVSTAGVMHRRAGLGGKLGAGVTSGRTFCNCIQVAVLTASVVKHRIGCGMMD